MWNRAAGWSQSHSALCPPFSLGRLGWLPLCETLNSAVSASNQLLEPSRCGTITHKWQSVWSRTPAFGELGLKGWAGPWSWKWKCGLTILFRSSTRICRASVLKLKRLTQEFSFARSCPCRKSVPICLFVFKTHNKEMVTHEVTDFKLPFSVASLCIFCFLLRLVKVKFVVKIANSVVMGAKEEWILCLGTHI